MNTGKYGRSSAALKELLAADPQNMEARRLFATLHLKLGSLVTARQAFEALAHEAIDRQDYWLAESLLREYLAAGPRCVPFLELLSDVHREKGDEAAAVAELGRAVEILRDDLDPEHAEKAAEIYAKIRKLAPASPVALKLASLFDVQTGEFLVRHDSVPLAVEAPTPTAAARDDAFNIGSEGSPSEVSPLDLLVSQFPTADSLPPSNVASSDFSEVSEQVHVALPGEASRQLSEATPPEVVSPLQEGSAGQQNATVPDVEEGGGFDRGANVGLNVPEVTAESDAVSEPLNQRITAENHFPQDLNQPEDQNARTDLLEGELPSSAAELPGGGCLPMPWDQHADASVQIPESASVDAVPNADASVASPPISLPADTLGSETPASNDLEFGGKPDPASCELTIPSISAISADATVAVPSPMPWEEVADPSLQIPVAQPDSDSALVLSEESQQPSNCLAAEIQQSSPSADILLLEKTNSSVVPTNESNSAFIAEGIPNISFDSESQSMTETSDGDPQACELSLHSVRDMTMTVAEGIPPSCTSLPMENPDEVVQSDDVQYPAEFGRTNFGNGFEETPATSLADAVSPADSSVSVVDSLLQNRMNQAFGDGNPIENENCETGGASATYSSDIVSNDNSEPVRIQPAGSEEFRLLETWDEAMPVNASPEASAFYSSDTDGQNNKQDEPVLNGILESNNQIDSATSELSLMTALSEIAPPRGHSTSAELSLEVQSVSDTSDPASKDEAIPAFSEESLSSGKGKGAVQVPRHAEGKSKWEKESKEVLEIPAEDPAPVEDVLNNVADGQYHSVADPGEETRLTDSEEIEPAQVDTRPEWIQESESISFFTEPTSPPETQEDSKFESDSDNREPVSSAAVYAVDELFPYEKTGGRTETQEAPSHSKPRLGIVVPLHRVRMTMSSCIGSCMARTRSLTFFVLMVASSILATAAVGFGGLAIVWMLMEEPPSPLYQSLTITPPSVPFDFKKNGYFLLLGFDAPDEKNPVEVGYMRKASEADTAAAQACVGGEETKDATSSMGASAHVVKGWFRKGDSVVQIKPKSDMIRKLATQESALLARYQQWLRMSFDDRGYGQILSPNCARILFAHRLFLLEGFSQDPALGLDRLERDIQSWRGALAQSRTLATKMLALTALQDDATMASGLVSLSELETSALTRLSRMVRPFDRGEGSLHWPMQSAFVWETKAASAKIKEDKSSSRPWYVSSVAAMRLPIQRRANAYAEYYEEASKAVDEGRFSHLPKVSDFLRTPEAGLVAYLANPIENIVGLDPLPSWDPFVMRMIETEARFRLVGLQAWIRRGPQGGDVLTRLAQAGQAYYDPFTGLPMLVNQSEGLIYSVGKDGKDQEGDRNFDVAVAIPIISSVPSEPRL